MQWLGLLRDNKNASTHGRFHGPTQRPTRVIALKPGPGTLTLKLGSAPQQFITGQKCDCPARSLRRKVHRPGRPASITPGMKSRGTRARSNLAQKALDPRSSFTVKVWPPMEESASSVRVKAHRRVSLSATCSESTVSRTSCRVSTLRENRQAGSFCTVSPSAYPSGSLDTESDKRNRRVQTPLTKQRGFQPSVVSP